MPIETTRWTKEKSWRLGSAIAVIGAFVIDWSSLFGFGAPPRDDAAFAVPH